LPWCITTMLRLGNLNISWLYQLLLQLRITKVCISDHMGLDCPLPPQSLLNITTIIIHSNNFTYHVDI